MCWMLSVPKAEKNKRERESALGVDVLFVGMC